MELISDTIPVTAKYIGLTLFNNTPQEASYGQRFYLQHYNDSVWEDVIADSLMIFQDLAYFLHGDRWSNYKYTLSESYEYKPGKYRLLTEIRLSLETDFIVPYSIEKDSISGDQAQQGIFLRMKDVTSDTVSFVLTNHTSVEVHPLEDFFIHRYDEESDNWMDYYYPSSNFIDRRKLAPIESTQFDIALNKRKWFRYHSKDAYLKGEYLLPGKYRIRKYVLVPVSAEFVFADGDTVAAKYRKVLEEKPLRNMPEYVGGDSTMNAFLLQHMKYPIPKSQMKEYTYTVCDLDIDSLGQMQDYRIRQISDSLFADESLRLLKLLQDWLPASNVHGPQPSLRRVVIDFPK